MKISREKLLEMWGLFDSLSRKESSVKFHYTILKNKRTIEPEIESLKASNQTPEEYGEFEKKRLVLCKEYSEKDENNKPKISNNNFVINEETKSEFETKLSSLKEEYKLMFEKMEKAQKEFMDLLKEEIEVDLVKIPLSIMPQDLLGQEVEILFDLVLEDK